MGLVKRLRNMRGCVVEVHLLCRDRTSRFGWIPADIVRHHIAMMVLHPYVLRGDIGGAWWMSRDNNHYIDDKPIGTYVTSVTQCKSGWIVTRHKEITIMEKVGAHGPACGYNTRQVEDCYLLNAQIPRVVTVTQTTIVMRRFDNAHKFIDELDNPLGLSARVVHSKGNTLAIWNGQHELYICTYTNRTITSQTAMWFRIAPVYVWYSVTLTSGQYMGLLPNGSHVVAA